MKTASDNKYERRFDRSTVILKLEFMDKNSAYIQFLKQWDEGKAKYLFTNNNTVRFFVEMKASGSTRPPPPPPQTIK